MKKFLLVFIIIIAIIVIAIPICASWLFLPFVKKEVSGNFPSDPASLKTFVYESTEPWVQNKQDMVYLGYRVITDTELAKLKSETDLTRRYPTTLKALFNPGGITNTTDLLYYSDELADLGVNTYWVIGEYRINDNKVSQFMPGFSTLGFPSVLSQSDAKKMLAYRILLAKQRGFASILIPDFPSITAIGRVNYDITKVDPELKRNALELAALAEEYQAEYFSPMNEYEHNLYSNGYSVDEIVKLEKAFYDDIVPQIRKIYHGKIVFKCGNLGDWPNFVKLSMKGADLFGVGNAYTGGTDMTTRDMTAKAIAADLVSARDNVPWIESEFLIYRPIDQENWMGKVYSTYPIEKSYQEGTAAFERTAKRAVGFTFMSWTGVGRIRGTASAQVLKNFYARWQPSARVTVGNLPSEYIVGFDKENSSLIDWLRNWPDYYILVFKLATGQMRPQQKEAPMGMAGPGGCKGKEQCEEYCSKPENRDECQKFSPGERNDMPSQGNTPDGCKTQSECQSYCSDPKHSAECQGFKGL